MALFAQCVIALIVSYISGGMIGHGLHLRTMGAPNWWHYRALGAVFGFMGGWMGMNIMLEFISILFIEK